MPCKVISIYTRFNRSCFNIAMRSVLYLDANILYFESFWGGAVIVEKGFALIEVMIVVLILGVLSSIAIPQYQDYIARTQVTRAVAELSSVKVAIEHGLMNGVATPDLNYKYIGTLSSSLVSLPAINFFPADDGYGSVSVTMGGSVSAVLGGVNLILEREQNEAWGCFVDANSSPSWKTSYLPQGCVMEDQIHPVVGALGDD